MSIFSFVLNVNGIDINKHDPQVSKMEEASHLMELKGEAIPFEDDALLKGIGFKDFLGREAGAEVKKRDSWVDKFFFFAVSLHILSELTQGVNSIPNFVDLAGVYRSSLLRLGKMRLIENISVLTSNVKNGFVVWSVILPFVVMC